MLKPSHLRLQAGYSVASALVVVAVLGLSAMAIETAFPTYNKDVLTAAVGVIAMDAADAGVGMPVVSTPPPPTTPSIIRDESQADAGVTGGGATKTAAELNREKCEEKKREAIGNGGISRTLVQPFTASLSAEVVMEKNRCIAAVYDHQSFAANRPAGSGYNPHEDPSAYKCIGESTRVDILLNGEGTITSKPNPALPAGTCSVEYCDSGGDIVSGCQMAKEPYKPSGYINPSLIVVPPQPQVPLPNPNAWNDNVPSGPPANPNAWNDNVPSGPAMPSTERTCGFYPFEWVCTRAGGPGAPATDPARLPRSDDYISLIELDILQGRVPVPPDAYTRPLPPAYDPCDLNPELCKEKGGRSGPQPPPGPESPTAPPPGTSGPNQEYCRQNPTQPACRVATPGNTFPRPGTPSGYQQPSAWDSFLAAFGRTFGLTLGTGIGSGISSTLFNSINAPACSNDPAIYAQQQQQYQQQVQQYQMQMQQYQQQMQMEQYRQQQLILQQAMRGQGGQYGNQYQDPYMQQTMYGQYGQPSMYGSPTPPQMPQPCKRGGSSSGTGGTGGTGPDGNQCPTPPTQPPAESCAVGYWKSVFSGVCLTNWQCTPVDQLRASISCQPKVADAGMTLAISYSCTSGTASSNAFQVTTQPSGTATLPVATPPIGANTATYSVLCTSGTQTSVAQCSIQVANPSIVFAGSPPAVQAGSTSVLGWVTSGMKSCVVSSPDQADFTARNASITTPNGTAVSSPISASTRFLLQCETQAGGTRSATTTITVAPATATAATVTSERHASRIIKKDGKCILDTGNALVSAASAAFDIGGGNGEDDVIPCQYIVVLKDSTNADTTEESIFAETDSEELYSYRSAFKGFAGRFTDEDLEAIKKDSRVDFVDEDRRVSLAADPRPPLPAWLPKGISRVQAAAPPNTGKGIHIAAIDTGIQTGHPDLKDSVVGGKDCTKRDPTEIAGYYDENGHGTHVAGTIAAHRKGAGIVGIAPEAKLWSVRSLDGQSVGSHSSTICGIDFVTSKAPKNGGPIRIANMSVASLGTSDNNCGNSNKDAFHKAICGMRDVGVTIIVAAGNEAKSALKFAPAAYDDAVITVSALADTDGYPGGLGVFSLAQRDDYFAEFSNYGSVVDIGAPGYDIYSTWIGGTHKIESGTSMAAPHVAGAAALYIASHPNATWREVRDALVRSGESLGSGHFDDSRKLHPEPVLNVDALLKL